MEAKLLRTEVWFKLVLLVFFGFLYWLAIPYPEKSRQFPQLVALFSLILIVLSLVLDFARRGGVSGEVADVGDTELTIVDESVKRERTKRFCKAWAIILVSTAVGFWGGFLFSTFLFFVGSAFFFGKKENFWRNTLVAVGVTAIIYLVFQKIMGVPLLAGAFW